MDLRPVAIRGSCDCFCVVVASVGATEIEIENTTVENTTGNGFAICQTYNGVATGNRSGLVCGHVVVQTTGHVQTTDHVTCSVLVIGSVLVLCHSCCVECVESVLTVLAVDMQCMQCMVEIFQCISLQEWLQLELLGVVVELSIITWWEQ